jgi:chromosome segregation ATPase
MEQFQQEIHQMKENMRQLNSKVDKILEALSGNDLDKSDQGTIGDVRELKRRVAKLERWKDRVIYALIGVSFGAGWTISDLLQKFFYHK